LLFLLGTLLDVLIDTLSLEGYRVLREVLRSGEIRDFVATNTAVSPFSKINVIPELVKFYTGKASC